MPLERQGRSADDGRSRAEGAGVGGRPDPWREGDALRPIGGAPGTRLAKGPGHHDRDNSNLHSEYLGGLSTPVITR